MPALESGTGIYTNNILDHDVLIMRKLEKKEKNTLRRFNQRFKVYIFTVLNYIFSISILAI